MGLQSTASLATRRKFSGPAASRWLVLLGLCTLAFYVHAEPVAADNGLIEQGRRIYQEGVLPSGQPLHGQRPDSSEVVGEAAACVKCHRQSGMGSLEGNIEIPPITGRFLFAGEERPLVLLDTRTPSSVSRAHDPYTDDLFAKALREGVKFGGKTMHPLMPRYALGEADVKALTAYLRQLSTAFSPGVGADTLRFATVITPGVDPKRRDALVGMMRAAFTQRNASQPTADVRSDAYAS